MKTWFCFLKPGQHVRKLVRWLNTRLMLLVIALLVSWPHLFIGLWASAAANLLCQVACPVGWVQNLIVKDWEVERQAQPDGMRCLHLGLSNIKCLLVRLLRVFYVGCLQPKDQWKKRNVRRKYGGQIYGSLVDLVQQSLRRSHIARLYFLGNSSWKSCITYVVTN